MSRPRKGEPRGHNVAAEDNGCLSHREIARRLGISHGRVQQIEARALEKLRRAMIARGLI